jgi:hypothetical protein
LVPPGVATSTISPSDFATSARIDDFSGRHLGLDLLDPALDEALLLARRVVLGVLRQVPVGTRFRDGLDDIGPVLRLQPLQFRTQRFGAAHRHGSTFHTPRIS